MSVFISVFVSVFVSAFVSAFILVFVSVFVPPINKEGQEVSAVVGCTRFNFKLYVLHLGPLV